MDGMIYHEIMCPTLTKTGACTCKQLIEVVASPPPPAPRGWTEEDRQRALEQPEDLDE